MLTARYGLGVQIQFIVNLVFEIPYEVKQERDRYIRLNSQYIGDVKTHTPHTHTHKITLSIHKRMHTNMHFINVLAISHLILLV